MQDQLLTTIIGGGTAGLIAALLFVIICLMTGQLVPRWIHQKVQAKLDRYENVGFAVMAAAEKLAGKTVKEPE